jgi:serine/threonine protein kinase
LAKFLEEARTLAQLDHPNSGAGAGLLRGARHRLSGDGLLRRPHPGRVPDPPAEAASSRKNTPSTFCCPSSTGCARVHAKGFLHRDIKPANIYLTAGNRPILLDFGAARQAMGEHSRSLSVVLSEGYAPIEQYQRNGQQGPWTDVYGAAATLYTMLTGQVPPSATDRLGEDRLPGLEGLSTGAIQALRHGLASSHAQRPATIADWQRLLLEAPESAATSTAGESTADPAQPTGPARPATPHAERAQTGGLKWIGWFTTLPPSPLACSTTGLRPLQVSCASRNRRSAIPSPSTRRQHNRQRR